VTYQLLKKKKLEIDDVLSTHEIKIQKPKCVYGLLGPNIHEFFLLI